MTQGLSMDISMIYIALSGLLMVGLAVDVVRGRLKYQVGLGDGGHEALGRRIRVHGNAVEYLPIGLLLLLAVENGRLCQVWQTLRDISPSRGQVIVSAISTPRTICSKRSMSPG